jgi:hypothetical protein
MQLYQPDDPVSQSLEVVLRDVRSAFQKRSDNRADVSVLLELYGSIISLCARAQRIRAILPARSSASLNDAAMLTENGDESDELELGNLCSDEIREFDGFCQEILVFGRCLTEVNLAAIDIYFPGLRDDLLRLAHEDVAFRYMYVREIAPLKYGFADREPPTVLIEFLDRYKGWGPTSVGRQLMLQFDSEAAESLRKDGYDKYRDMPARVSIAGVLRIIELLEACRAAIRNIVRENWGFRDLLDRQPAREGGIYVAGIEYNVSGSQVGAVGPGAHVHDVTFQQQVHDVVTGIDATVLAEQLERLQAELAKQASERDHYAALVAVSDAAADAREGKTASAIARLAAAGRWVADIASNIGVSVAAEAIKRATGLT